MHIAKKKVESYMQVYLYHSSPSRYLPDLSSGTYLNIFSWSSFILELKEACMRAYKGHTFQTEEWGPSPTHVIN